VLLDLGAKEISGGSASSGVAAKFQWCDTRLALIDGWPPQVSEYPEPARMDETMQAVWDIGSVAVSAPDTTWLLFAREGPFDSRQEKAVKIWTESAGYRRDGIPRVRLILASSDLHKEVATALDISVAGSLSGTEPEPHPKQGSTRGSPAPRLSDLAERVRDELIALGASHVVAPSHSGSALLMLSWQDTRAVLFDGWPRSSQRVESSTVESAGADLRASADSAPDALWLLIVLGRPTCYEEERAITRWETWATRWWLPEALPRVRVITDAPLRPCATPLSMR